MSDASVVRAGETLVLGNGRQLALLDVDEAGIPAAAYTDAEQRGRFTGERLFSTNRSIYDAIVKLLARGLTYREIADVTSVSVNTVCGVAWREQIPIETLRERIGRLGLDVSHLTMECIRDLLADPEWRKDVTAKDLAIIHGISFTNAQLALGGATARMETVERAPAPVHADYEAFIKNVTGTHQAAGNPGQKEAPPALDQARAIDVEVRAVQPTPSADAR